MSVRLRVFVIIGLFFMPKTRSQKDQETQTLVDRFGRMKSVIFSSYSGLTVPQATALRKKLREQGVDYQVAKKTLLSRALAKAGMDENLADKFEGGLALAFGYDDEVLPAKLLSDFTKEFPALTLQGGIIQGQLYGAAQVQALAKLPSRTELLAMILGSLNAPASNMVRVLAGPARAFVQVLHAASTKQSESA